MTIRQYVRALRRRAWIPILLVAVAVLGTGTLVLASRPQYTATATVIANSPSTGANRTLNFSDVVGSNTLQVGVIDALDLADDPASLAQRISVTNDRSSNLYRITVTDPDPKRATAIANAVAESATRLYTELGTGSSQPLTADTSVQDSTYLDQYQAAARALTVYEQEHPSAGTSDDASVRSEYQRRQLDVAASAAAYQSFRTAVVQVQVNQIESTHDFGARIVDPAVAVPDTSSRAQRLALAAALGLLIGLGAVFGLELVDSSVREPEDAERLVGAPLLGVIAHADVPSRGAGRPTPTGETADA